jgi:hypothetical protein
LIPNERLGVKRIVAIEADNHHDLQRYQFAPRPDGSEDAHVMANLLGIRFLMVPAKTLKMTRRKYRKLVLSIVDQ